MYPNACMETNSDDEYFGDGEIINQDNALKEAMENQFIGFLRNLKK
jgi:hypothetical protein